MFDTDVWERLTARVRDNDGVFHFIGLLSDGNIHSHVDHLFAMLRKAAEEGVKKARLHILTDGRDVAPRSALSYIEKTENLLAELRTQYGVDYRIASGGGRMLTTMDRYNADWDMVRRGWETHVLGEGRSFASAVEAVQTFYTEDPKVNDQYLPPFVIAEDGRPVGLMQDGDSVVFFNFRGDRAIEISLAFDKGDDFDKFDRGRKPDILYAGMMQYDGDLKVPAEYLVNPPVIDRAVSLYMLANGIHLFAGSETQKYGHVTFFWNGNKSGYINKEMETYFEIPSDNVPFDQTPRMKAKEIAEKTIELVKSGQYQFGRINFPNGDMVGHTGVPEAIVESVTAVFESVERLVKVLSEEGWITVVLADHGNADEMFKMKKDEKVVSTSHSLNPVPFAIVDSYYHGEYRMRDLDDRGLANVAGTVLNLLGFEQPADYQPSLIEFVEEGTVKKERGHLLTYPMPLPDNAARNMPGEKDITFRFVKAKNNDYRVNIIEGKLTIKKRMFCLREWMRSNVLPDGLLKS